MKKVLAESGIDPLSINYIEAHGTGTKTGDPAEIKAIKAAYLAGESIRLENLRVGSVKGHVGHGECMSGLLSIIKSTLMLKHKEVYPTANFHNLSPLIDGSNLSFSRLCESYPSLKRVSVNNFGYGGSNAHVVLQESESDSNFVVAFPFSFESWKVMSSVLSKISIHDLKTKSSPLSLPVKVTLFADSNYDLERSISKCNLFSYYFLLLLIVLAVSDLDSVEKLQTIQDGLKTRIHISKSLPTTSNSIALIFGGQGSQWERMGKALFDRFKVFKESVKLADSILKKCNYSWSPIEDGGFIEPLNAAESIQEIKFSLVASVIFQLGLVNLLRHWGLTSTFCLGHSSGEIAASYSANWISFEDAIKILVARARVSELLTDGLMMAVFDSEEQCLNLISSSGLENIWIAAVNSRSSCTLTGSKESIQSVADLCFKQNIKFKVLNVSKPFHSPFLSSLKNQVCTFFYFLFLVIFFLKLT
jgi:acyl transferase domain-containing protein